jgi:hypothetical protein
LDDDWGALAGLVGRVDDFCVPLTEDGDAFFHPKKLAIAPVLDLSGEFPSNEGPQSVPGAVASVHCVSLGLRIFKRGTRSALWLPLLRGSMGSG